MKGHSDAASVGFTPASAVTRQPIGSHVQRNAVAVAQSLGSSAHIPVPSTVSHQPHPTTGVHASHEGYCEQLAYAYAVPTSELPWSPSHAPTSSAPAESTTAVTVERFVTPQW
jgi:hypothetical protein